MKTYKIMYLALVCLIVGCSKSENGSETLKETGSKADYTLLVNSIGLLKAQPLNATSETLTINPGESPFEEMVMPRPTFKQGTVLTMYQETTACGGEIIKYDFNGHSSNKFEVFSDLGSCDLTAKAVLHSDTGYFIAYSVDEGSTTDHFVRVLDASGTLVTDVSLSKDPVELAVTNNRLFILNFDEEVTGEHGLTVMDLASNGLINEMNLGFDVRKIFVNKDAKLVISYDTLHTIMDPVTFGETYINYQSGLEPKFADSSTEQFDANGKLYYERPPTGESEHANVPAIYDFASNTAFLYIYENFLTEDQIDFEFEIDDTTMVGFDEKNGYMLIGYRKAGSTTKGGLLRVKPVPEPAFIDNVNVDGIPYDIYVK
ncbi:YncE family protein [Maribacter halichondriae]|uniref:YncE family protein n=1 Tax=Maribacter halichondriae TaxID=2980554 RepID=UPI0023588543|nr:hypothetical protein [Maribacter sp. Hal144]